MLKIKTVPVLMRIISKIDILPAVDVLKNSDVFEKTKDAKAALKQLSGEKAVELGVNVIASLTPQLGKIADDIPEFVAMYKGITVEEAVELDAADIIAEVINDNGIKTFFEKALRKKVEQGV